MEELKLMLETVSQVSDGAKLIAILWLLKGFLTPIIIIGFGFWTTKRTICYIVSICSFTGVIQRTFCLEIDNDGDMMKHERKRVMACLQEYLDKS